MERRHRNTSTNTYLSDDIDDPQTSSENGSDSPASGDDSRATATAPSSTTAKKSRRSIKKRVVAVPIAETSEGSRSRSGEAYPPSDSWTWRKYGQKPIKGSPYPRGYYRCSSSKGCPARKQVERSKVDPTTLLITYSFDHNHSIPISSSSKHHHHHHIAPASNTRSPPPPPPPATPPPEIKIKIAPAAEAEEKAVVERDEREKEMFVDLGGAELYGDWMSEVAFEVAPAFVGSWCEDLSVGGGEGGMKEEEEELFADLDELPECSAVFRRGGGCLGFQRSDLGAAAAPLCGSTG
ncbi:hypothetical protein Drorol1_Dr00019265 [Drosera rotundifolia]